METPVTITREERDLIVAALDTIGQYLRDKKKNWLDAEEQARLKEQIGFYPTNEQRSAVETHDFVHDPPESYFAYVSEDRGLMTTWTGEKLGTVSFGGTFASNFGDARRNITVTAINGLTYHGTYYKGAGDYCRVKRAKKQ